MAAMAQRVSVQISPMFVAISMVQTLIFGLQVAIYDQLMVISVV